MCAPFDCDDPDLHLRHEVPMDLTPLRSRGCHCGADFDGRDCMCFEGYDEPESVYDERGAFLGYKHDDDDDDYEGQGYSIN